MLYRCPKCDKLVVKVTEDNKDVSGTALRSRHFPFCSERCKLLDIGAWLDEEYRIEVSGEDDNGEEDSWQ